MHMMNLGLGLLIFSLLLIDGFATDLVISTCRHDVLHERMGIIASPNYPHSQIKLYKPYNCTWYIHTEPNDTLTISFDHIDLVRSVGVNACHYQFVEIGPVCNQWKKRWHRYCGQGRKPPPFVFTGSECGAQGKNVWVRLQSSALLLHYSTLHRVNIGKGFRLQYVRSSSKEISDGFLGLPCPQPEWEIRCKVSGKCIPQEWRCNGLQECGEDDNSDETGCLHQTDSQHFTGIGSYTLPWCDTGRNYFMCDDILTGASNMCMISYLKCNGQWDCVGGLDERGCGSCGNDEYSCGSGNSTQHDVACYHVSEACDGIRHCAISGIDESEAAYCGHATLSSPADGAVVSPPHAIVPVTTATRHVACWGNNAIRCRTTLECYSLQQRCDGLPQCSDGSDETNCDPASCSAKHNLYLCPNNRCIHTSWLCDNANDCGDNTDEKNCSIGVSNSVIAVIVISVLVTGLLLVILSACVCKIYRLNTLTCLTLRRGTAHHMSLNCTHQASPSSPRHASPGSPYHASPGSNRHASASPGSHRHASASPGSHHHASPAHLTHHRSSRSHRSLQHHRSRLLTALEAELLYREAPPSYTDATGIDLEQSSTTTSHRHTTPILTLQRWMGSNNRAGILRRARASPYSVLLSPPQYTSTSGSATTTTVSTHPTEGSSSSSETRDVGSRNLDADSRNLDPVESSYRSSSIDTELSDFSNNLHITSTSTSCQLYNNAGTQTNLSSPVRVNTSTVTAHYQPTQTEADDSNTVNVHSSSSALNNTNCTQEGISVETEGVSVETESVSTPVTHPVLPAL